MLMEDDLRLEEKMFEMADAAGIPIYGVLELLPICNMNCDMCYVRMDKSLVEAQGGLRPLEEWKKIADEMKAAGTLFVLLTGGEPLLYPGFKELYTYLRSLGLIITINTNGTLVDKAWADFFEQQKPRRVNITLYGGSNETYETLCHLPGGFDKTMTGIRNLQERGIAVKLNGSLARGNLADRERILEIGEELDIPVRIDTYMYPVVRERQTPYNFQSRMDPVTAGKVRVEVLKREMGDEIFDAFRCKYLDLYEERRGKAPESGKMTCRAGRTSFVVNWQGELRSCVVLDKPSIRLCDHSFDEAWQMVREGVKELRISEECCRCQMKDSCLGCVAAAMAETGDPKGVPEYLCRMTETFLEALRQEDNE